jgi:glyoxylase-like metal-dependent hydrolase (beta-lactamase superfamily II)
MRDLAPGVWDWQTRHPEWEEGAPWGPTVSSHAIELDEGLVLFDPLGVPDELREKAVAVVLTAPWHERDTRDLGLPVYAPRPESREELIVTFDVDPARIPDDWVSSDLKWLVHEGGGEFHEVPPGPFGIEVFAGRSRADVVLWVERTRTVVAGDTLADWGDGLKIHPEWLSAKVPHDEVVARLRPLLDKPVELVLPAHGLPTDRAALERALGV